MALTKFNFNSFDVTTAASSALAFNSSANGFDTASAGAMNLISTNTISSGVSSSSITSGINSTYDTYLFKLINIHPATVRDEFQLNFRDGSSAFDASKQTTMFMTYIGESGGDTALSYETEGVDLTNSTSYFTIATNVGNGNDEGLSGELYLFSPSSTTFIKHFICVNQNSRQDGSGGNYCATEYSAGYCNTTAAIDGIDFKFAGGNIDSGIIKMYGITK